MTAPFAPAALHQVDPLFIDFDPTQPRQEIDQDAQDDLEASVREVQGIRTPIMVVAKADGRYQLLYGERRLRAVQTAMLPAVPCLVVPAEHAPSWMEALDTQLIENLCRAELRPLEIAQGLWRRILGANIEALEEEQGDDGRSTAQLLANYLTPASQIAALEDRLCVLAGVATVADYFGGGRVRVARKAILARYGMADWSASRLKKLFQALDVASDVQDLLSGVDVSARALRELGKRAPDEQTDLVQQAKTAAATKGMAMSAARYAMRWSRTRRAKRRQQRSRPRRVTRRVIRGPATWRSTWTAIERGHRRVPPIRAWPSSPARAAARRSSSPTARPRSGAKPRLHARSASGITTRCSS